MTFHIGEYRMRGKSAPRLLDFIKPGVTEGLGEFVAGIDVAMAVAVEVVIDDVMRAHVRKSALNESYIDLGIRFTWIEGELCERAQIRRNNTDRCAALGNATGLF